MKALFVSKAFPAISGSGVGARMHYNALSKCLGKNNVFVVNLGLEEQPKRENNYLSYGKYKNKFERVKRNLQLNTYFFSDTIITDIITIVKDEKIGFVFLDDSTFGKLALRLKKCYPDLKIAAFYHDVKAELYPRWMKRGRFIDRLINSIEYKIGMFNEKILSKSVDANIVLNRAENVLLKKHYGIEADYYFPVCVSKKDGEAKDPYINNLKKHILFVGTSYAPNINGIKWFYSNVYSSIRKVFDVYVVGRGLEILKEKFNDSDIHIIGFAENLHSYYKYADVVIAPLTDGGGMKIKTAEAISYGKVFVGSSESLHGYYDEMTDNVIDKLVFKCDSAEDYIKTFMLLNNTEIKKCNDELIEIYSEKFSEEAAIKIMRKIIVELTGTKL